MEYIIYLLVIVLALVIAATLNYRRSVLATKETFRLHKEAEITLAKAQQQYNEALQTRIEAQQAKDEATRAIEEIKQYWDSHRLN